MNRQCMDALFEFLGENAVDHAVPFDAALSIEGRRYDIDSEMRFAAGTMPGMTGVEMLRECQSIAPEAVRLVLTARAENYLHGRPDLGDTISRLQAFQEAGADVLYAPGLTALADIRQVVASVDRAVNVLVLPGGPAATAGPGR